MKLLQSLWQSLWQSLLPLPSLVRGPIVPPRIVTRPI